jgi:hypothetical protein
MFTIFFVPDSDRGNLIRKRTIHNGKFIKTYLCKSISGDVVVKVYIKKDFEVKS